MDDQTKQQDKQRKRASGVNEIQGGVWLIGLAALFYFDIFWPGILILIGLSSIVEGVAKMYITKPD